MGINLSEIKSNEKKSRIEKQNTGRSNFLNKDITFFKQKLGNKKKEGFYSELGVLLASGIDIKTALEIIMEEQKSISTKEVFSAIYNNILNGDSLSVALEKEKEFTPYEINTIKIGEESSRLIDVLGNLTEFYAKRIKQRRQLINAFSYPVIIVVTAIAAVYFMLNFMVPMFEDVFQRFNGNLPGLTQSIIKLSNFFASYMIMFFFLLMVLSIYFYVSRKKIWFRASSSRLVLSVPFVKKIVRLIYLERFFQAMALLAGAKIPLLRAIKLVREMVGFYPFEVALKNAEMGILHGKLLHESLGSFKLIDKKISSLIKVGEETNQLQYIFEKLNSQHSEELEFQIGMISSILEPFIIIFIGLLVGIILIAMYLPMFQMGTSVV